MAVKVYAFLFRSFLRVSAGSLICRRRRRRKHHAMYTLAHTLARLTGL